MKKSNLLIFIVITVFAFSCDENKVMEEHSGDFPNYRWEKSNVVEFKPKIEDTDSKYQISIAFRHVYGFQLKKVKLNVTITSPSGKEDNNTYKLKVGNESSGYNSECAGDYCDLVEMVEKRYKFKEEGVYTIKISQDTKEDPLPNVMELGLIINKKVKEKKEDD